MSDRTPADSRRRPPRLAWALVAVALAIVISTVVSAIVLLAILAGAQQGG